MQESYTNQPESPAQQKQNMLISPADFQQIRNILHAQSMVPRDAVELATDEESSENIFETLNNGNPVNAVIRDQQHTITAFMACENRNNGKTLYIKYAASNGNSKIVLRHQILGILSIIKKHKLPYQEITFHGFNPVLNRAMSMMGFIEVKGITGHKGEPYFSYEVPKPPNEKVSQWMEYLYEQSPETLEKLSAHQIQLLKSALFKSAQQNENPKINEIYGALQTVLDSEKSEMLGHQYSIKKLHQVAKQEFERSTKERDITEFMIALQNEYDIEDPNELKNLLIRTAIEKIDLTIKTYFQERYIEFDSNDNFYKLFYETKVDQPPKLITSFTIGKKEYNIYALFRMSDLKHESDVMDNCVGRSDSYFKKIRDKKAMIFSIRDKDDESLFTIEYDLKNQSIDQFKGPYDLAIGNTKGDLVILEQTLNVLHKNGYPTKNYTEEHYQAIIYLARSESYKSANQETLADILHSDESIKGLGGTIEIKSDTSSEKLAKIANVSNIKFECHQLTEAFLDNFPYEFAGSLEIHLKKGPLPKILRVKGNFDLQVEKNTPLENVTLPEHIDGNIFVVAHSLSNVTFPKRAERLVIANCEFIGGCTLPTNVDYLSISASAVDGIVFDQSRCQTVISFLETHNIANVTFPQIESGTIDVYSTYTLNNVAFPETINGNLNAWNTRYLKGKVILPKHVTGDMYFGMEYGEEMYRISLPKIDGKLILDNLITIKGYQLHNEINEVSVPEERYTETIDYVAKLGLTCKISIIDEETDKW